MNRSHNHRTRISKKTNRSGNQKKYREEFEHTVYLRTGKLRSKKPLSNSITILRCECARSEKLIHTSDG